jgi:hypothetical protein
LINSSANVTLRGLLTNYSNPVILKDFIHANGLSKLEIFAAMAMQGILSKANIYDSFEVITECSVICAEKLINELNKKR